MMSYQPNPKHIRGDFYAVKATNWLPVNRLGQIIPFGQTKPIFGTKENNNQYIDDRCPVKDIDEIIALTFVPFKCDLVDATVEHINGIKLDNRAGNLRWRSPHEEPEPHYRKELKSNSKSILVKDLETEEVNHFYSLQECGRFFECNGASVYQYLSSTRRFPFRKKYAVIYEGEEWPPLTKDDINYFDRYGNLKAVVVEDVRDGKQYIFATIIHVESHYDIPVNKLKKVIDTNEKYKDYYFYYLNTYKQTKSKVLNKPEIMEQYVTEKKYTPKKRKACQLKVTDLSTGDFKIYDSIWDRAEELGMKKNSLEKSIWRTNGYFKGYLYEYLNKTILNKREKDIK
nr:MAG TPA: PROTEIN/DNA Complex catalytic motif, Helix-turn-helix DNA [Caudoviricetes sp.]